MSVLIVDELIVGHTLLLEVFETVVLVREGKASKATLTEVVSNNAVDDSLVILLVDVDSGAILIEGRGTLVDKLLGSTLYEYSYEVFIDVLNSNSGVFADR